MGRKNPPQVSKTSSGAAVSAKAPAMKYAEASKLADKNSRTIAKLEKLVLWAVQQELINSPGYQAGDPNRIIERYADKLKRRINRRLTKLARWSDSSAEERQAEFRRFFPSSSYNAYRPSNSFVPAPHRPTPQPQHVLPPAPVHTTQPPSVPHVVSSSTLPAPPLPAGTVTVKPEVVASDPIAIVEQKVAEAASSAAAVVTEVAVTAAAETVETSEEAQPPIASEANEAEEDNGDNTDDAQAETAL